MEHKCESLFRKILRVGIFFVLKFKLKWKFKAYQFLLCDFVTRPFQTKKFTIPHLNKNHHTIHATSTS